MSKEMKQNLVYAGVVTGIILAVLSMVFGAFMPMSRAQSYISAMRTLQTVKTIDEFKNKFRPVLDHPSPAGDEEIFKYLSSDVANIISQNDQEDVRRELVNFIEPYADQGNVRHLMTMGQIYSTLWRGNEVGEDYKKAEEYFLKARAIGPNLPPVLYSLMNLYSMSGDKEKLKEVAEAYLAHWPEDENVKNLLR